MTSRFRGDYIFSGKQSRQFGGRIQRFRDPLRIHHQRMIMNDGSWMMMEIETVSETLDSYSELTRLVPREDFITRRRRCHFRCYYYSSLRFTYHIYVAAELSCLCGIRFMCTGYQLLA